MKKLVISLLALLLLAAMLAGGCAKPAPAPPAAPAPTPAPPLEPIKIGYLLPMTGVYTFWGQQMRQGFELRLDEAKYQVAGRPIEIIIEDEGPGDPAICLDKARKLAEADKVRIIFGPFAGGMRLSVLPYTAQNKIINMAYLDNSPAEMEIDWNFSTGGPYAKCTGSMARYAYDEMGIRTVTTLGPDYVAGHAFVGGFNEQFKKMGGTVIQETWTPFPCEDYMPYLSALKPADAFVVWVGGPVDTMSVLTQYNQLGLFQKMPMIWAVGEQLDDVFMAELGDFVLGIKGGFFYHYSIDNPANKKFVAAFEAKYGEKPQAFHAGAYASCSVILAALEATGGDDTDPEKLRQAIMGLKMELPGGSMHFRPVRPLNGEGMRPTYVGEVQKVNGVKTVKLLKIYPAEE